MWLPVWLPRWTMWPCMSSVWAPAKDQDVPHEFEVSTEKR